MISKALIGVAAVTSAAALFFLSQWIDAERGIVEERALNNQSVLQGALDAERLSRQATISYYEKTLANQRERVALEREAQEIAQAAWLDAVAIAERHEVTIDNLIKEAPDDIPDSDACLNVFIHESAIRGLRSAGAACTDSSPDGLPGTGEACTSTEPANRRDPAAGDFSNITYSDSLILWGRDRKGLAVCNGNMRAIRALGEEGD